MAEAALVSGLVAVVHAADLLATDVLYDFCVDACGSELVTGGDVCAVDDENRGESHGRTWLTLDLRP